MGPPLSIINEFIYMNVIEPILKGMGDIPTNGLTKDNSGHMVIPKAMFNTVTMLNVGKLMRKSGRNSSSNLNPHPGIIASHHFSEPYPLVNEIDLLYLATMDLLIKEEITFTIGPSIPLTHLDSLKPRRTELKPFIVADTETILIDNVHKLYAAGLMMVCPGEEINEIMIDTYLVRITPQSWIPLKKGVLRFDGIILLKHLASHHKSYKLKPLMRNNRLYELVVYSGKKILLCFRDSLNLLPGKLANLAKNSPGLGQKGSIPYDEMRLSNLTNTYRLYGEDLFYYDVNSLYPFVMKEFPMPGGVPVWHGNLDGMDSDSMFGFIEAYVVCPKTTNKPFLPYIDKNKTLIFPTGEFVGVYYSEELKYTRGLGYKVIPISGYLFEGKVSPFRDFVSSLFDSWLEARKEGNQAMAYVYKVLMNSLYGRFGINPKSTTTENNYIVSYHINIRKDTEHWNPLKNSAVQLAAAITASARIHMYPYISREDCYYTDTNSVVLGQPLPDEVVSSSVLVRRPISFKTGVIDWHNLNIIKKETLIRLGIKMGNKRVPVYHRDAWVDTDPIDIKDLSCLDHIGKLIVKLPKNIVRQQMNENLIINLKLYQKKREIDERDKEMKSLCRRGLAASESCIPNPYLADGFDQTLAFSQSSKYPVQLCRNKSLFEQETNGTTWDSESVEVLHLSRKSSLLQSDLESCLADPYNDLWGGLHSYEIRKRRLDSEKRLFQGATSLLVGSPIDI
ncbi:hypothetical protein FNV43_RR24577 [Rhamnella rubrinervis]|uniref:DNA-directed DNA polymerase n=1 Tax=Rhamnella rubrinervis TaxID=2594499 RepID=A0A8K0DM09_9ROSA|nr:hypothetical protein FNV43_RR24577 [Rhamnella rubrinervis]